MTDNDDVFSRLSAVVRKTFRVPEGTAIVPSTSSAHIEGWDSLSHSILVMHVEDEFHVELDLRRVYEVHDLGELAVLIRQTRADTMAH